jgi:hypothetical protein
MAVAMGVRLLSSNTPTAMSPALVSFHEAIEQVTFEICAIIFLLIIIYE